MPLHWACNSGNAQAALFLISRSQSIQKEDRVIGWTPLHLAASSGSVKIVRKLLIKGVPKKVLDH